MFKKNNEPTALDLTIAQGLNDMQSLVAGSDEYTKAVEQITKLHKLKEPHSSRHVTPDVLVTAGANILGIVLILHYEQLHPLASKALGFVMKLK